MDLTEFLRARLDEDERVSKARIDGADWMDFAAIKDLPPRYPLHDNYLPHFNPYRMLAEVEAKRRILDMAVNAEAAEVCSLGGGRELIPSAAAGTLFKVLRELAGPYADHPDFDRAWVFDDLT